MTSRRRYQIRIKRSAEKEMDRLPKAVHDRVASKILSLEDEPRPPGCKQLRGQNAFRIRSGDYRILYAIDERAQVVHVFAAGHRREVYRG